MLHHKLKSNVNQVGSGPLATNSACRALCGVDLPGTHLNSLTPARYPGACGQLIHDRLLDDEGVVMHGASAYQYVLSI